MSRFLIEGDVRRVSSQITEPAIAEQLKVLEPIVINSYTREYLISRNRKVRITLDRDIRYNLFNQDNAGVVDPATVVVEIKADQAELDEIQKVGRQIPLRRDRLSKYVTALQLLFGTDM